MVERGEILFSQGDSLATVRDQTNQMDILKSRIFYQFDYTTIHKKRHLRLQNIMQVSTVCVLSHLVIRSL